MSVITTHDGDMRRVVEKRDGTGHSTNGTVPTKSSELVACRNVPDTDVRRAFRRGTLPRRAERTCFIGADARRVVRVASKDLLSLLAS